MQLQMQDILNFSAFYEAVKSQKLGVKTAYKLSRLNKAIDVEIQLYRERLQAIIGEYGLFDERGQIISTEDGSGIKLRPGTEAACLAATQELQTIEIVLPDITFSIDEFDGMELTLQDMSGILSFIIE